MSHREKHRQATLLRRVEQGRTIKSDLEDWTPHVPKTKRVAPTGKPSTAYKAAKAVVTQSKKTKKGRAEFLKRLGLPVPVTPKKGATS